MAPNRAQPGESGKTDDRSQVDKFRDLAREIGADEDPEAFKAKLRKVATAPKAPVIPKGKGQSG
jgi:hypothetical protein